MLKYHQKAIYNFFSLKNNFKYFRFLGRTNFSDGVWVGLELSQASGRNDGVVKGRRYFTCKPGHGIMLKPNRVSLRGVPGSELVPLELSHAAD